MKINRLVDDLDGSIDGVLTYTFSLDGKTYEIDLSKENYQLLFDTVEPFIEKARVLRQKGKSPVRVRSSQENSQIRQWARQTSWPELPDRGRIPDVVLQAYAEAHS